MAWKQKIGNGLRTAFKELLNMFKGLLIIWLVIALVIAVVFLIVKGTSHIIDEPISPEVIIRDYYEAIENEDFETVKKLIGFNLVDGNSGINEEIRRSNEEFYKKEMVKWARGFRTRGGFERVSVTNIKEQTPFEDKIKVLGIKIWTKHIRNLHMNFTLYVNDGFIGMVPGWYEEAGIMMEALFIMTKEGWKLSGARPSNSGSWDLVDKWLE